MKKMNKPRLQIPIPVTTYLEIGKVFHLTINEGLETTFFKRAITTRSEMFLISKAFSPVA